MLTEGSCTGDVKRRPQKVEKVENWRQNLDTPPSMAESRAVNIPPLNASGFEVQVFGYFLLVGIFFFSSGEF